MNTCCSAAVFRNLLDSHQQVCLQASQCGSSVPVYEVAFVVGAAVGTSLVAAWAASTSPVREVGRPCEGVVGGCAGWEEKTEEERGAGIP